MSPAPAAPLITPGTLRQLSPTAFDTRAHLGGDGPSACRLPFLVGLDVVLEVDAGFERAVRLLRLVLEVDVRALHRHAFHRMLAAAGRLHAGDQDLLHLDNQVILLPFAGLARGQGGFLDVLTGGTRLHQHGRRLVDAVHEAEVRKARLAGAAAAAHRHRAGLGNTPRPGEDIDLAGMLAVLGFALDVAQLQKNVYSHSL